MFMRTCAGRAVAASLAISLGVSGTFAAMAAESPPLTLQTKIPLGDVKGRIDHLAIDHARQRLFVAEFGNNSLGVVDLKDQKVFHRVAGLTSPKALPMSQLLIVFSSVMGAMDHSVFSAEATFRPSRGWNSRPMPTISGLIQSRIWYSRVSVRAGSPLSTQSRAKRSARSI